MFLQCNVFSRKFNEYLCVLVCCDCGEGCFWESERLEDAPAYAVQIIGLDDVETWVVAVHGVQDDLNQKKEREVNIKPIWELL